jgi:hypothetical protein
VLLLLSGLANPGLAGPLWMKVGAIAFVLAGLAAGVLLKVRIDRHHDARREPTEAAASTPEAFLDFALDGAGAEDTAETPGVERAITAGRAMDVSLQAPEAPVAPSLPTDFQ